MRSSVNAPQFAFIGGMLLYLLCLWRGCPQLDDKGYFLAVLVLGVFTIVAYRQTMETRFTALCRLVLLLASGLLLVGVWNMPLSLVHKGLIAAAWFACLYGAAGWSRLAFAPSN